MKKIFVLLCLLLGVCFSAHAQQSPLLIGGWNRFPTSNDAAWWEANAHLYDEAGFDAVMHVLETVDFTVMDRVIAEDQKRKFQIIVTVDGTRNTPDVLRFFEKYHALKNAEGEALIRAAIIGWDQVNNLHPDDDYQTLKEEMQVAVEMARLLMPDLPIYLCVSYERGATMAAWYQAMKSVPHTGIWLYNIYGYDADLSAPLAWIQSKGETNIVLGGVYGFKYFQPKYRSDLVQRSAKAFPELFQSAQREGYAGVCLLSNFDAAQPFGSTTFLNEGGQPNELFQAIKALRGKR